MPYTLNRSDGTQLVVLGDQQANTSSTSLTLIGKGFLNFGEDYNENFIKLLENFAKNTPPANPMVGQFWYDKAAGVASAKLKVWDGTAWKRVMVGPDDANLVPGVEFGAGLTVTGNTVTANMLTVAGRSGNVVLGVGDVAGAAPIVSPAFTGNPQAPTADTGTNTTQIATTAFVRAQIAASSTTNVTTDTIGDGLTNDSGTVIVVSEDDDRIVVTPGGINISPTYSGQTTITTLGTVTTGVWDATTIAIARGGTGATTAEQALTNLGGLKYNSLAHTLKDVGTGLVVNNNGTAVSRKIVSGTPDKLVVNNPNGETGDITISLTGDNNTGPIPISAGGTGATSKDAALNALSPTTTFGDMIFRNNAGGHSRLAGRTDGHPFYLESGSGNAAPRWTSNVNASSLGGYDLAYVLSRNNHTGEVNAGRLGGFDPNHFLNYANFFGTPNEDLIFYHTDYNETGGIVFKGTNLGHGFQFVWSRVYVPGNRLTTFNFPFTFARVCFGAVCSGGEGGIKSQDNNPFVANVNLSQVALMNSRDAGAWAYYLAYGF